MFADKISAEQADKWGLIWEAVSDETFEEVWHSRANHLANGPTIAYGYLKEALKSSCSAILYDMVAEGENSEPAINTSCLDISYSVEAI